MSPERRPLMSVADEGRFLMRLQGCGLILSEAVAVLAIVQELLNAQAAQRERLIAALRNIRETCPCDSDINSKWEAAWNQMLSALADVEDGK